jgi:hypothetical protein
VTRPQANKTSRGPGRCRPRWLPDDADASPEIQFSECLYDWIQVVVELAVETGDLESHELSADQRAAAGWKLEANFGITTPRFFGDYQQTTVEVRIVVFNTA